VQRQQARTRAASIVLNADRGETDPATLTICKCSSPLTFLQTHVSIPKSDARNSYISIRLHARSQRDALSRLLLVPVHLLPEN
jgi:hypothetical protein